ncbi:hypothetical protein V0288_16535 [Pannus brasiliensis CCIBt3594]|uniref:Uncharacterized protein n=1 Tax=Pannus brasiliensis CCIBt3594 TaxID=1427578 RepID=A0AAW9QX42_9CHRO
MSPEDDNLVSFLRQHRPSPPEPRANLEEEILRAIEIEAETPRKRPIISPRTGAISIAAIALLLFGFYRWSSPTPRVATISDRELEAFLADNWNETLYGSNRSPTVSRPENTRTTRTEPRLTYSTYHP